MTDDDAVAAFAAVLALCPDDCDRDQLAAAVSDVRRLKTRLDAVQVGLTRRARELADTGQAEPAESLLGSAGGMDSKDANTATAREELCNQAADVEDALNEGAIATGYVDAIAAAANSLPENLRPEFLAHRERLLAAASVLSVDAFRKRCRQLARDIRAAQADDGEDDELSRQRQQSKISQWVDKTTGMHHIHAELDPERAAKVAAAISRAANTIRSTLPAKETRSWRELEVDGYVTAITGGRTTNQPGSSPGSAPAEIQVLIDYQTLVDGLHEHGIAETIDGVPLPVSAIRRMCCEANIIPTVLDGHGRVLDVGRAKRTATAEQRHALAAMHATCAHPHCNMPFNACRIHHLNWWTRDLGPTDLDNLIPVCEHHHHQVHEGGWQLTMTPDRVATWTRPDGAVFWSGSAIDRHEPAA
ncbi:MAG: HNH endonuclease [Actinomycetota bacterium]